MRQQILSGEVQFIGSEDFPHGCCDNASKDYLLPRLKKAGFTNTVYVNAWHEKQNHGWLEYKGYIIDITADQFEEENNPSIMVIKKEESEFHKMFNEK